MTATIENGAGAPLGQDPAVRFSRLQVRVLALVLMLYVVDGIDTQILSVAVATLAQDWALPLSAFGAAMAAGYAGSAAGALVGGISGDRFGRKRTAIGGTLLFGAATISMALLTLPAELVVARFVAGVGLGGCLPPCLALLAECMPRQRQGLVISLAMLCHPLGISVTGLAAAFVLPVYGWQALFVLAGSLPLFVSLVLTVGLPESPAWLLRDPARAGLARDLLQRLRLPEPEPEYRTEAPARQGQWRQLSGLFAPQLRGQVMALLAGFFFAYLAMTMVLSWLPALLTTAGYSQKAAGSALFIWSMSGVVGIFLAGVLTVRFGVRLVLAGHLAGALLALCAIVAAKPAATGGDLPLWFSLLIALGGYMMNGTMTSLYALAAATFDSRVRASGIGLSATLGRIGAIVGALLGARAIGMLGARGFFAAAAVAVLLALLALVVGRSNRSGAQGAADPAPVPAE